MPPFHLSRTNIVAKYSEYKLILKDLPDGKTKREYALDDAFFKLINDEDSDVKRGKVAVVVEIARTIKAFELKFSLNGDIFVPCDRCLDDVVMPVDVQQKLIVKFGKEYSEESDEIVVVPEDEGEINIAWFLYEFIVLSLPAKRVHPAGSCNKVVSQKLKKHRAIDPNDEDGDDDFDDADDDQDDDAGGSDPRWDALKDLEMD